MDENEIYLGQRYSNKIMCFGELLLRLTPEDHERLEQTSNLQLYFDGAEAMCAASLAQQNDNVAYAGLISDNRIGKRAKMTLDSAGVDTTNLQMVPGRVGLFYLERGTGARGSVVTYDRMGTPMALAKREDFDWDYLLNGVDTFFFTGVLPAISDEMALIAADALKACKGRGIRTYCDINYRRRMWSADKARKVWEDTLFANVDVLICSDEDLWYLYPPEGTCPNKATTLNFVDYYAEVARRLALTYDCDRVAVELRETQSNGLGRWQGMLIGRNGKMSLSEIHNIADCENSGCGDAFSAGVIHATKRLWRDQRTVEYAIAASMLKSTIMGSMSYVTEDEIIAAIENNLPRIDH